MLGSSRERAEAGRTRWWSTPSLPTFLLISQRSGSKVQSLLRLQQGPYDGRWWGGWRVALADRVVRLGKWTYTHV